MGSVENIVGKKKNGENAGNHHFLLFRHCFSKAFFHMGREKSGLCCEIKKVTLCGDSLTVFNKRIAEKVERDQTARMCSLISLYTLRKMNYLSQIAEEGFIKGSVIQSLPVYNARQKGREDTSDLQLYNRKHALGYPLLTFSPLSILYRCLFVSQDDACG